MKKFMKILAIYLLFGIVFAIIITVSGGYQNTVVSPTAIGLTTVQYVMAMFGVMVFWLPVVIFLFFSKGNYLSFSHPKIVLGGICFVFVCSSLLAIRVSKK
ncbi:MAG: hypothetical protein RSA20_01810 [Oscillospiraceae bacterium]